MPKKTNEAIKEEAKQEFKEELRAIVEELKPKPKIKDKEGKKEIKVTVRLKSEKERENLNKVAKKRGLSTNDYIKFLIKEFPKLEREFKKLKDERKEN